MKRIKVYDSALVLLFGLVFSLNSTAWALHNGPVSYNDSGVCGEDVTYRVEDGTLYIQGTGDMYDYFDTDRSRLWDLFSFTRVKIASGVTSVGSGAFYYSAGNGSPLTEVILPTHWGRSGRTPLPSATTWRGCGCRRVCGGSGAALSLAA